MKYYIEIGACDYDTETDILAEDEWVGVCVEPNPQSFANLVKRSRKGTFYENSAIHFDDRTDGTLYCVDLTTIPADKIEPWVRGISSVSEIHVHNFTGRNDFLRKASYRPVKTNFIKFSTLIHKYEFYHKCDFIKIDTEGLDADICFSILHFYINNYPNLLPHKIQFEHHWAPKKSLETLRSKYGKYFKNIKEVGVNTNIHL
jgi:hypothetical protein